ncbi:hypothetical protein ACWD4O_25995 [Streptomyces sp. NPDC002623]
MDLDAVAAEITAWEREGMRLVTILDEDYPLCLRLVHQRPPFLFLRGTSVMADLRVAVVDGPDDVFGQLDSLVDDTWATGHHG